MTRFWSDYQALEDRLFDRAGLTKLAIDVEVGEWQKVEATVSAWLQLPPAEVTPPDDPGRPSTGQVG